MLSITSAERLRKVARDTLVRSEASFHTHIDTDGHRIGGQGMPEDLYNLAISGYGKDTALGELVSPYIVRVGRALLEGVDGLTIAETDDSWMLAVEMKSTAFIGVARDKVVFSHLGTAVMGEVDADELYEILNGKDKIEKDADAKPQAS
jgi:hypothetical protein